MVVSTTKLVLVAALGFCAMLLATGVLTLQLLVLAEKERLGLPSDMQYNMFFGKVLLMATSSSKHADRTNYDEPRENTPEEILDQFRHTHPKFPPEGASHAVAGDAYWAHVTAFIKSWDATLKHQPQRLSPADFVNNSATEVAAPGSTADPFIVAAPLLALERAAHAGHADAQLYLANAYASGIWPVRDDAHPRKLHVTDEFVDQGYHVANPKADVQRKRQLTKAYLYWQMAAMAGNSEAMMALAYRHEYYPFVETPTSTTNEEHKCSPSVAYYEAAAHSIMDDLERDPQSRAKVKPPTDKHHLATFYMRGGTASQLDWNNQPDEQDDALQFYHLKATAMAATAKDGYATEESLRAAFTLGDIYRRGQRGVPQNATLALYYYDLCASHHHWMAAGHAGMIRLWQMGDFAERFSLVENRLAAMRYFETGAPAGLDGCRRRHEKSLRQSRHHFQKKARKGESKKQQDTISRSKKKTEKKKKSGIGRKMIASDDEENGDEAENNPDAVGVDDNSEDGVAAENQNKLNNAAGDGSDDEDDDDEDEAQLNTCDAQAVNGLGLVYLLGIPDTISPDPNMAEKYFILAKEMGSIDANYNLAMIWLGWRTHYKRVDDLDVDGISDLTRSDNELGEITTGGSDDESANFALHVSRKPDPTIFKGPTQKEFNEAIRLLNNAMSKGHLQARHRLGMIYAKGIRVQGNALPYYVIKPDCQKAKVHFQSIVEAASPHLSRRLRAGYKNYMSGNLEASLRNYLFAAETGSSIAQANAAFLMERGTCLGLSDQDCAKASVRLWKAAAARDDKEACLRLGDYYYNGQLRPGSAAFAKHAPQLGPFGWIRHILFLDEFLLLRVFPTAQAVIQDISTTLFGNFSNSKTEDGNMVRSDVGNYEYDEQQQYLDFATAAHYYRLAVEKHNSARANYNLGFLHEWGLGLKQDFPLAKRHYDLAGEKPEAVITAKIALWAMFVHERVVRFQQSWDQFWSHGNAGSDTDIEHYTVSIVGGRSSSGSSNAPSFQHERRQIPRSKKPTATSIILSHVFSLESLLIFFLTLILMWLFEYRRQLRRR